jgi:hypothetical protein
LAAITGGASKGAPKVVTIQQFASSVGSNFGTTPWSVFPTTSPGALATFICREGTFVGRQPRVLDMITKVLRDTSNLSIVALERNGDRLMPLYVSITEKTDAPTDEAQGNGP